MKRSGRHHLQLLDTSGQMLSVGDRAVLAYVDRLFLYCLPVEQQGVYEAQCGQEVRLTDQDDCGNVAIEFTDQTGRSQRIWTEPRWLRRMQL